MTLTREEIDRYKRHLVLHEVGGQGQQKLKAAKVLVVGAGGLGSPVLMYLAAAGVGTLGIIDDDHVSLDNLQRQVIKQMLQGWDERTPGRVESIARALRNVVPSHLGDGELFDFLSLSADADALALLEF